ncbi:hypothetical protein LTR17_012610 [Elasticomyces elasticus]|nr:hypothetical protein LTR17_012610 [Elasticomyces elasticus]
MADPIATSLLDRVHQSERANLELRTELDATRAALERAEENAFAADTAHSNAMGAMEDQMTALKKTIEDAKAQEISNLTTEVAQLKGMLKTVMEQIGEMKSSGAYPPMPPYGFRGNPQQGMPQYMQPMGGQISAGYGGYGASSLASRRSSFDRNGTPSSSTLPSSQRGQASPELLKAQPGPGIGGYNSGRYGGYYGVPPFPRGQATPELQKAQPGPGTSGQRPAVGAQYGGNITSPWAFGRPSFDQNGNRIFYRPASQASPVMEKAQAKRT